MACDGARNKESAIFVVDTQVSYLTVFLTFVDTSSDEFFFVTWSFFPLSSVVSDKASRSSKPSFVASSATFTRSSTPSPLVLV